MHTTAYVGLGSNVGDRLRHMRAAVDMLGAGPDRVVASSSVYETEPVGHSDQAWFLNAVVGVEAVTDAPTFHGRLKDIERAIGRRARHRWGPREIDLDLLLFGSEIRQDEHLVIPHPRMHERAFVMAPLVEVAPAATHPARGGTMAGLLTTLDDSSAVGRAYPPTVLLATSQEQREA